MHISGTPNVQKMQAVNAKQMSDVIFCTLDVLEWTVFANEQF